MLRPEVKRNNRCPRFSNAPLSVSRQLLDQRYLPKSFISTSSIQHLFGPHVSSQIYTQQSSQTTYSKETLITHRSSLSLLSETQKAHCQGGCSWKQVG